ncbi:MAG: ATP-binding protein [Acidimicrobiales bacterium]|jgi:anti-sigma regulatory factor (Ser/Thr protein kinase)
MKHARAFEALPQSVVGARRFVTECVSGVPVDTIDMLVVIASELATNSVRHGGGRFELRIDQSEDHILIEVEDEGEGEPVVRKPSPDETSGRGLQIVKGLADSWGVERSKSGGKTVWAIVALPARQAGAHDGELATPVT